jgi:OmpA-OmpF porin, OOP family
MKTMGILIFALNLLLLPINGRANASEPMSDEVGGKDMPWLQRFAGSKIISYTQKAYDEYVFATGALVRSADIEARDAMNNAVFEFKAKQTLEGKRTRIIYLLPPGRTPLEALRGYEQTLLAQGASKRFECAAETCGGEPSGNSDDGGGEQNVAMKLWPGNRIAVEDFNNRYCAQTMDIADQHFGAFELPGKAYVMVHAYLGKDDLYCKVFNDRVITVIDALELAPREEKMVTVSASEMNTAISNTGRVAIYGILFDSGSSVIKPPSQAALAQIAALLTQNPAMKLHVVGHTDNQVTLENNFVLSKARAAAIAAALSSQFAIAATRLTANGVSSLAPVASNADEAGRAKNRRVELVPF